MLRRGLVLDLSVAFGLGTGNVYPFPPPLPATPSQPHSNPPRHRIHPKRPKINRGKFNKRGPAEN